MKIIIVDESDSIIGHKKRGEVGANDIFRSSALWLTNSKGEILLAERGHGKDHAAGKWGPAVVGTNELGETYESNIIKEAGEELGLHNLNFTYGPKMMHITSRRYFVQWFLSIAEQPTTFFKTNTDEVESVRWYTPAELLKEYSSHPSNFVDSAKYWIPLFVN